MDHVLKIGRIRWIHLTAPSKSEINELVEKYDFHELIVDDITEMNTQYKVDVFDNYLFIVMHYPKYNQKFKKYDLNEFQIILGKNFIITISRFHTNHINLIKKEYEQELEEDDDKFKISPYYILYKIIDVMYDKTLKMISKINKDVMDMEDELFDSSRLNKALLENLTIKKRNMVFLKHTFMPQNEILSELQETIQKFYEGELDVYFEDLVFKLEKIQNSISVLFDNVDSLTDTYNSLMTIHTNNIVTLLTIFTAITGILTLISGIYGMNIILPLQNHPFGFMYILWMMIFAVVIMLWVFKKKGWM